jgi:hypothetical protein
LGGETRPPSQDDIIGVPVVAWASSRVETISQTGGEILGNRPLELDAIEVPVLTLAVGAVSYVWGWKTIIKRAEARFIRD